jgi:hypothetical protein
MKLWILSACGTIMGGLFQGELLSRISPRSNIYSTRRRKLQYAMFANRLDLRKQGGSSLSTRLIVNMSAFAFAGWFGFG